MAITLIVNILHSHMSSTCTFGVYSLILKSLNISPQLRRKCTRCLIWIGIKIKYCVLCIHFFQDNKNEYSTLLHWLLSITYRNKSKTKGANTSHCIFMQWIPYRYNYFLHTHIYTFLVHKLEWQISNPKTIVGSHT